MISELLRRLLYGAIVQSARRLTDMQVHYRIQYAHDYGLSARWFLLRMVRLWLDGHRCTHRVNLRRCEATTRLQVHHTSYRHKGKDFFAELADLRTLCDEHHNKES